MAAVSDLGPEEAGRHQRPPSVHSVITAAASNQRQGHDTDAMRARNDIKAIGAGATGKSLDKTCDEVAPSNTHPLSVVLRSQRRGLLGRFALIPEINNSYEYGNSTTWGITAAVSLATVVAPMGSSISYRMHTPLS
ncbi:hypothetical protein H9L39_13532 [Fusarium oxysporum f. sp. albedinis]|jgi:hypothetical protein|nr:hypothetical protein H9L39_13532 [Fusarium oxysporum f. sp. albedinis]